MSQQDGGSAFPLPTGSGDDWPTRAGMSLRDWFAGQALTRTQEDDLDQTDKDKATLAEWAYGVADAMLAAREKPR